MRDDAPCLTLARTMEGFKERVFAPIKWQLFSSQLNSIQARRNRMKTNNQFDYLDLSERRQWTQDELRLTIIEAWDNILANYFMRLIETMPSKYQAVPDADVEYNRF
ncbi:hypothetical protein K3495_g7715 [Podosphaera aphanis]|nr:hypothetical protein K3495_g7715 [Podosphaera aphanis]